MEFGTLLRSFERLCELPAGSLESGTAIESIDGWDSLRVVELVAMLDSDYGVTVEYEKLAASKTVGELLSHVEDAGARTAHVS